MLKILVAMLMAFLFAPSSALADNRGVILIHAGYGTAGEFVLRGRVLEDKGIRPADKERDKWGNVVDSFKTFETDELEGVTVEVEVNGRTFTSRSNDDGVWEIEAKELQPPLPAGTLPIKARVKGETGHIISAAHGVLHIVGPEPGVAVISDFDDTVVNSGVTDKKRLLARTLTKNAAQMEPVAGVTTAFRWAVDAGARGIFYLSGSPQNLHERIVDFLSLQHMPRGPVLLKNFGEDPLTEQVEYKVERIGRLMTLFPQLCFVLVGDSGEKDPEIYKSVTTKFPGRVVGIVIRRVTDADNRESRFGGMTVVDDYSKDSAVLATLIAEWASK